MSAVAVSVWLLVSLGTYGKGPIYSVAHFDTQSECLRVATELYEQSAKVTRLRCTQVR